jgi:nitrogen-specific signal transduction histidine kinase
MPDPVTGRRLAALADLTNALGGARCAAQLAGLETDEFLVRELLLRVIDQIDRAAVVARRLV